jgi:hypothetical protein
VGCILLNILDTLPHICREPCLTLNVGLEIFSSRFVSLPLAAPHEKDNNPINPTIPSHHNIQLNHGPVSMHRTHQGQSFPPVPAVRFPANSAVSPYAYPDEDWRNVTDLAERRRIQNRIAQRNYRMLSPASSQSDPTAFPLSNDLGLQVRRRRRNSRRRDSRVLRRGHRRYPQNGRVSSRQALWTARPLCQDHLLVLSLPERTNPSVQIAARWRLPFLPADHHPSRTERHSSQQPTQHGCLITHSSPPLRVLLTWDLLSLHPSAVRP